jgi:hypothetical protein
MENYSETSKVIQRSKEHIMVISKTIREMEKVFFIKVIKHIQVSGLMENNRV